MLTTPNILTVAYKSFIMFEIQSCKKAQEFEWVQRGVKSTVTGLQISNKMKTR